MSAETSSSGVAQSSPSHTGVTEEKLLTCKMCLVDGITCEHHVILLTICAAYPKSFGIETDPSRLPYRKDGGSGRTFYFLPRCDLGVRVCPTKGCGLFFPTPPLFGIEKAAKGLEGSAKFAGEVYDPNLEGFWEVKYGGSVSSLEKGTWEVRRFVTFHMAYFNRCY
ncbi:hypothetical protein CDAR_547921 [Caerostris darwini]|uniref:Uncharacterized protein n=1 Tax=Caerostris darwini TaxID=1538125 RepID=A0AAV4WES8_9ARAC|nr:hypothetical protein CDAR_547921 [Caerostris darwini]